VGGAIAIACDDGVGVCEYRIGAVTGVETGIGALRLVAERLGSRRARREGARSGVVDRTVELGVGAACCVAASSEGALAVVGVSLVTAICGGEERTEVMRRREVSYSVAFSTGRACQSLLCRRKEDSLTCGGCAQG